MSRKVCFWCFWCPQGPGSFWEWFWIDLGSFFSRLVSYFSHNIYFEGLLNSLAQVLCRHSWISSFRTPFGETPKLLLLLSLDPSPFCNKFTDFRALKPQRYTKICFGICFIRFNASLYALTRNLVPTTFMLRVTFSPAPDCVVADCWNRAFPTPRATRPLL